MSLALIHLPPDKTMIAHTLVLRNVLRRLHLG